MKKKITILLSFFSLIFFSSYNLMDGKKAICSFSIHAGYGNSMPDLSKAKRVTKQSDKSGIYEVVNSMKSVLEINPQFDIYLQPNIDNAYALLKNGKKSLVFDVNFLKNVNSHCGSEWCAIQIIAHEIGHHIHGFSNDSHENELGADYWSGYILAKLGASEESTLKAIETYGSQFDTDTHPNMEKRMNAISEGFQDADN